MLQASLLYKIFYIMLPLSMEGSLVNETHLLALYLSGTYCHKNGTRPPSCVTPRQTTIYSSPVIQVSLMAMMGGIPVFGMMPNT